jgi:hypothetical protein
MEVMTSDGLWALLDESRGARECREMDARLLDEPDQVTEQTFGQDIKTILISQNVL